MVQKLFQIDAFTDQLYSGNPAAVCILENWIDDSIMQNIARENNLAETAFAVKDGSQYIIRWFTPELEVDLCGHATLATAYVLFNYYDLNVSNIEFFSPRSGKLLVEKGENGLLILDFPTDDIKSIAPIQILNEAIGKNPVYTLKGKTDYLLIYSNQEEIEQLNPNFFLLNQLDARGVIVSAPGNEVDFVSRFFAPKCGVNEDPVTGSAHTSLIPYWSKVLGKSKLVARQLSKRGGDIYCEFLDTRVKIAGRAVPYLKGEIII
ncbi:PhzF family phenazine biosynthesis protein [uncultured Eudoraea sp.]|uniref:PhzF family phenazine biosynthesis protein n=1 Tax=uncultured Eudoraea sp. TaxID=1035614 RepID=UPI00260E3538|nr:PhzF family phenazine biosynthesis protein [uncultured Eudoraea sp.]